MSMQKDSIQFQHSTFTQHFASVVKFRALLEKVTPSKCGFLAIRVDACRSTHTHR
eukprot:m.883670 g.883670  ORF g.883670 m.883670 type:complete len:55 (+) comp23609_c0_seq2:3389-3553(+)